jgi:Icc-related predicted phosphoesterase
VPVIAILGNHDYHGDQQEAVTAILREAGITVLECSGTVLSCGGVRVGVAGTKGFGGGFAGACASEFGEPEMRTFARHGRELAARFGESLAALDCDVRIALTHYSPVPETLLGEPLEIYPFLGSYQLAQAIDAAPAVGLAIHGHAHAGSERGTTPGGVPVRNVAHPVIRQAYNVYQLSVERLPAVLAPAP